MLVAYVGADERYGFVNARYAELFGRDQELVGKHLLEVLGQTAYETIRPFVRQALAGETVEFQRWLTLPDGKPRYFRVGYVPHREGGAVRGFMVHGLDVTTVKQAEEARHVSEERFQAVFENAAVGIILATTDVGRIVEVNQRVCDTLGYSREELLGLPTGALGHPDDAGVATEAGHRLVAGEVQQVVIEKRYLRRDGTVVWAHASMSLLRGRHGEPQFFIAVIEDISARKEAEQALAESERMYRSVFENAAVGMARLGRRGEWLEVNDRLCVKLRYSREELLGRTFEEITHPDDLEENKRHADRLIRGEIDFYELDKRYLRGDGSVLWAHVTASSVHDEAGELLHFVAVVEDITDRKEAEAALRAFNVALESRVLERTAELHALNQELDAFNYSVSHDLRAPLRGIDGFSQAVLEEYGERLDARGRRYLERVRAGAVRMGELIDALLMLSRFTRGPLHEDRVDLCALAHETALALQQEDPHREVSFEISQDLIVLGDERLLRVLMRNLLENAWKFTRHTSEARIEVGCMRVGDEAVCFVRDNGAGFDPQYGNKLFAPFQRLHGPNEFEGMGIGLATVQRIVSRHGGRIWAEGRVGEGATFYFTLAAEAAVVDPGRP